MKKKFKCPDCGRKSDGPEHLCIKCWPKHWEPVRSIAEEQELDDDDPEEEEDE